MCVCVCGPRTQIHILHVYIIQHGNSQYFTIVATLNISALHHVSLAAKANTTEYCSDSLPRWIWVITGVVVKVGISPSGGALEALLDFISLRVWKIKQVSNNVIRHRFKHLHQLLSGDSQICVDNITKFNDQCS